MTFTFLDLTIRVGCHLTYEATAPTPVVFMLRPRLDDAHLVTIEKRSFEPDLPSNEFQDSHGNLACRSMLHEFERFKLPSATLPLVTRMFLLAVWDRLRNHCSPNHRELLERCFLALSAKPGGGTFDLAGFTRGAAGE